MPDKQFGTHLNKHCHYINSSFASTLHLFWNLWKQLLELQSIDFARRKSRKSAITMGFWSSCFKILRNINCWSFIYKFKWSLLFSYYFCTFVFAKLPRSSSVNLEIKIIAVSDVWITKFWWKYVHCLFPFFDWPNKLVCAAFHGSTFFLPVSDIGFRSCLINNLGHIWTNIVTI